MKAQIRSKIKQARKLLDVGQCKKAENLCLRILKHAPQSIEIKAILGESHYFQTHYDDAIEIFTTLLNHSPNHQGSRIFLFACYKATNQLDHKLKLAFQFRDAPLSPVETFSAFLAFQDACLWEEADKLRDSVIYDLKNGIIPHRFLSGCFLVLNTLPNLDPNDLFQIHRQWGVQSETESINANLKLPHPLPPKNKIKIAYLSVDFNKHPVGHLSLPIIQHHNKEKFEVYCYARLLNDDDLTSQFRTAADHFIDITNLSLAQAASKIAQDGIHILIDLSGHTSSSPVGVLAFKPAPVQITYLGYPNTTGLSCVDYRITDQHSESKNGTQYTEELLKMPQTFLCLRGLPDVPRVKETPAKKNGYITFGSFNHIRKANPQVIKAWAQIMQETQNSKLLIKSIGCDIDIIRDNILNEFKQHNITSDRIRFAPYISEYEEHAALYNQVDIALDTFPYHGTHTTLEALWMGVPVVTLEGELHVQRVSSSILKCIGFETTISNTIDEYIAQAVDLASRPDNLTFLRGCMHTLLQHSMIFKPQEVIKELESLYIQAWEAKMGSLPEFDKNRQSNEPISTSSLINQTTNNTRKLHIGGKQKHPEWEILDANESHLTDHVGNANDLSRFQDNTFDALYSSHVLEHFSYQNEIELVLKEWFRVIKPSGTIYASVPNLEVLCSLFLDKDKLGTQERFMVMRMIFGGQVDSYDFHKVGYSDEFLGFFLTQAGFENIKTVSSFGLFDDTSNMEFGGKHISLNLIAKKPQEQDMPQNPVDYEPPTHQESAPPLQSKNTDSITVPQRLATWIMQGSGYKELTIAEVGARIINESSSASVAEPFHNLEHAKVIAFEPDQQSCDLINCSTDHLAADIRAYPYALAEKKGTRTLYITQHGMCSSLYKPNEDLIRNYEGMEVSYLKEEVPIEVLSLDDFMQAENIHDIDFIKIDVQGAELNVFKGGEQALQDMIGICTEIEWAPLYENQPMFCDVDQYLRSHGFQLHHTLGVGTRPLKGINLPGSQQFLWSDAIYFPPLDRIKGLATEKLIKLAAMAALYEAFDITMFALKEFDQRTGSSLANTFHNAFSPESD